MAIGDWLIDPSVKSKSGGLPEKGNPRRCQGTNARLKTQCPEYARKGRFYCKVHGGNLRQKGPGRVPANVKTNVYVKNASKKLMELLTQAERDGLLDSLEAEITVARTLTQRSLRVFDEVNFGEKADAFDEKMKRTASSVLQQNLNQVAALMSKHAAIKAASDSTFSTKQVDEVINKVMKILDRHLGNNEDADLHKAILHDMENLRVAAKDSQVVINVN